MNLLNLHLHQLGEIGEFVAGIGGIITLILLIIQIRDLKKTVRGQTYQAVYSDMQRLDRFFFDNMKFHEHFYEKKELESDDQTKLQARIIAEMILDFSDNLYLQQPTIDPQQFKEWEAYFDFPYENSPILGEVLESRKAWYDPEYRGRMKRRKQK